jgi:hypothetical protein
MSNSPWYALHDQSLYVYHYTKSKTLIDHILPTKKLRFSRFQAVDDPRESRDWVFSYLHAIDDDFVSGELTTKLNDRLKHCWRIGCFVRDIYEALVTKAREELGEDIVGAIYERGHSRPRMWAQYGENHAGACLVFDSKRLDTAVKAAALTKGNIVHHGPVEYRNPAVVPSISEPNALTVDLGLVRRLGFAAAAKLHLQSHIREFFFLKSRDWEQEREFRWAVDGSDDEDFYVNIDDALVGILLGERCSSSVQRAVGQFAKEGPLHLATMSWQNGVPQPQPTHWRLLSQAT